MKKRLWNIALVLVLCLCVLPAACVTAGAAAGDAAFFVDEYEATLGRVIDWDKTTYGSAWGEIVDTGSFTARLSGDDTVYSIDADAVTIVVYDQDDNPVGNCGKDAVPDAGDYNVGLLFTGDIGGQRYTDAVVCLPQHLTVEKAWLDVVADDQIIRVGEELPALTYTISGFVNGEGMDMITGEPEICLDETPDLSEMGVYFISVSTGTLTARNYDFNVCDGLLYVQEHVHHFTGKVELASTYAANDTIVVFCDADGCLDDGEVEIMLVAPEDPVYDGGVWHTVGLYGDLMIDLDSQDVEYSGEPWLPGVYTASITYGGVTASVTYEVAKRPLEIVVGDLFAEVGGEVPDLASVPYTFHGFAYDEGAEALSGRPVFYYEEAPDTSEPNSYFIYAQPGNLASDYYQFDFDWYVGTLYVLDHVHSLTGEVTLGTTNAEGDTIVVTCGAPDCPDGGEVTITLYAPEDAVYDGCMGHTAGVGSDLMLSVDSTEIVYTDAEGEEIDYPLVPGVYTASITYEDVTASVTYEVAKRTLTLTADDKKAYTDSAEPTYTYTISGLAEDHEISGEVMVDSAVANMAAPGTYEICVSIAELVIRDGWRNVTDYYDIVTVPGTLTVVESTPVYIYYRIDVQHNEYGVACVDYAKARSGDRITVTAKANEGFVVGGVTVTTVSGRQIAVTDLGDGCYTFTMPSSKVRVDVAFDMPFGDIDQEHTFRDAVRWVYTSGYMIGKAGDAFGVKENITRQQICMVLSRIQGVKAGSMADAFAWGVENGILDNARPGEDATRAEMVAMLWCAYGKPAADAAALDRFSDVESLTGDEQLAMAWAVEAGVVEGYEDGTIRPAATTTRGAFAAVLHRYLAD